MREIDPILQASLDAGATTHCRCWKLTRKDGVVLGFTDHDAAVTFGGLEFRASSGLDATALQTGTGLSVDNGEVVGALTDEAITEPDIRAGRFDSAAVEQWLVDWRSPARRVLLFRGTLGEIRRTDRTFEAELRGPAEALNVAVGRTIQRTCDRFVGDAKCGVDLSDPRYVFAGLAAGSAEGNRLVATKTGDFAQGWFDGGVLRWTGGDNLGLIAAVSFDRVEGDRRVFFLTHSPPLPVADGDAFVVTAGCDKRPETCRGKFSNFLNFRGFPHIPGEDWLMAYPKPGEAHDGSSLVRW
jgi:uncharacterized phage protein (TIGR02218 family)